MALAIGCSALCIDILIVRDASEIDLQFAIWYEDMAKGYMFPTVWDASQLYN